MKKQETPIQDAFLLLPEKYIDSRGWFMESWNKNVLKEKGIDFEFVQDNHSASTAHVLRGLHYQLQRPQGKLIRVIKGEILDVIVDLRKSSKSFGKTFSVGLDAKKGLQLWAPPGVAHGFLSLSDEVECLYKVTEFYNPLDEHTIIWNDIDLNINWGLGNFQPIISEKDLDGVCFKDAKYFD